MTSLLAISVAGNLLMGKSCTKHNIEKSILSFYKKTFLKELEKKISSASTIFSDRWKFNFLFKSVFFFNLHKWTVYSANNPNRGHCHLSFIWDRCVAYSGFSLWKKLFAFERTCKLWTSRFRAENKETQWEILPTSCYRICCLRLPLAVPISECGWT